MTRRALVLGGGGFFGAFQAGAYDVLGDFDCVIGASAGALNGWAIASGMPPAQLQQLWLEAAESARRGLHLPRYLGDGILDTSHLEYLVTKMVREWRPRVDFGVIISQGWRLRQVLVRDEEVDANTLLASCAIPGLLPAKRVQGRLSLDGGLRDACPLWAARAMGATEMVAINVWNHLPSWWPQKERPFSPQPGVRLIEPPQALGPMPRSALASPEEVAEWIKLGRHTASQIFARQ